MYNFLYLLLMHFGQNILYLWYIYSNIVVVDRYQGMRVMSVYDVDSKTYLIKLARYVLCIWGIIKF